MVDSGLIQLRNPWSKGGVPKSSLSTVPSDHSTFWLDFPSLCQTFKTLYLNWNPAIFQYSSRKHFSFTPNGSDFDIGSNAQYAISVHGTGDTWILLQKHYLGKSEGWEGYIGISVFPGNERIYTYTRPTYRVTSHSFISNCRRNMWKRNIPYSRSLDSRLTNHTSLSSVQMTKNPPHLNLNYSSVSQYTQHFQSHYQIP